MPGLFGDHNTTRSGTHAEQEQYNLGKLEAYLNWARNDSLIVGMIPWHWLTVPKSYPLYAQVFGVGLESFPAVQAKLAQISEGILDTTTP